MKRAMTWTGWLVAAALLATTPVVAQAGALITGRDVKDASLTGADLRRGTVGSSDVADGSVSRKDLDERARPARTQVYELRAFEPGPEGGSTTRLVAFGQDVAPYTLVETVDIQLDLSNTDCRNGNGDLWLGRDEIAQYDLADDQATTAFESGDTGSAGRDLVFRFQCTDEGADLAGSSVQVTYQLTRRDLDHVTRYEG